MHFSKQISNVIALFAAGTLVLFAACTQQSGDLATIRAGERTVRDDSTFAYHYPATAPVLSAGELKRFVGQHRDQVVVVQFWASWSSRSREEIARLAKLNEAHRTDGLRVIACTFDESREWRTRTIPVLQAEGANFPCVVIEPGDRQAVADWLDPSWSNDVPAQFVVNRSGDTIARSRGDDMILAVLNTGGRSYSPSRTSPVRTADDVRYASTSSTSRRTATETESVDREGSSAARPLTVARASDSTDSATTTRTSSTRYAPRRTSYASSTRDSDRRSTRSSSTRSSSSSRTKYESTPSTRTASRSTYSSRHSDAPSQRTESRSTASTRSESTDTASRSSPVRTVSTSSSVGPASMRVRLINVRTGESEMLPVVSRDDGVDAAVEALMGRLRGRIPQDGNPRIAVLPLSSMRTRDYSTRLGMQTAESISAALGREGYDNLADPRRTESEISRAKLTQTKIEADPASLRGVVKADYLLMGWVRNDVDEYIRSQRTVIAGDSGGDTGYTTRRQEAEDFGEY